MNNLRRLGLAITLAIAVSGSAFAGETNSPPCPTPGETNSPPCSPDPVIFEDASETSLSVSSEVETIVAEAATYAIESLLTLF